MRVIDCECGAVVQGANDEELAGHVRTHLEQEHPDAERDDETVRALVERRAYTATDA